MQQEYYQEQAVAYAVMPEDVAHAFAFDSMAGYARGHVDLVALRALDFQRRITS